RPLLLELCDLLDHGLHDTAIEALLAAQQGRADLDDQRLNLRWGRSQRRNAPVKMPIKSASRVRIRVYQRRGTTCHSRRRRFCPISAPIRIPVGRASTRAEAIG